jgi:molybdopterin/thiamine biosynthesis adenylyltransferase
LTKQIQYEILFGRQFLESVSKANVLLVGAGGTGCQVMKILTEMNISSQ